MSFGQQERTKLGGFHESQQFNPSLNALSLDTEPQCAPDGWCLLVKVTVV